MMSSSPTSQLPQLPQELINAIIDYLLGDIPSLRACSLVCRAWTEHAQENIFHEQRFCTPESIRGDLHKFRDLLCMSPHLGAFVKTIKLHAFPDGWIGWIHPSRHHEMNTASPQVFPLLTNLKAFSFKLEHDDSWDQIVGVSVADAYKSTLRTASLTRVHLSWITFDLYSNFLHLMSDLLAVRELSLSAITIKTFDNAMPAKRNGNRPLRLISLHLNLDATLLQNFTRWLVNDKSPFDLGQIRSLTVLSTYDRTQIATLPSVSALEIILKRIETGTIIHLGLENALSSPLSSFPSLRNLKMIKLLKHPFIPSNCITFFAQEIIEGGPHAVEEFTVHFEAYRDQIGFSGNNEDWRILDPISGTDCHVRVRFTFPILLEEYWDEAVSHFTSQIQTALPNLYRKNLLHLDFQIFSEDEGDDRYQPYDDIYQYYTRG
ncbi:uncharacterized protein EV420DRAFT_478535 [Desarmillaria tabescens]|uniref:F-box domain-containing protein n=1 Tax=Armillaria tabescens TaxID=1929756 RepID=A0AA39N5A1_ARMTA|nr:uncharacterized protein EV420DRAFT_478535 [Desarmillaria tabescens]KAK0457790.1 hypothetical protein EV420DRAFT_478535 [Desarmillaria tabescens]